MWIHGGYVKGLVHTNGRGGGGLNFVVELPFLPPHHPIAPPLAAEGVAKGIHRLLHGHGRNYTPPVNFSGVVVWISLHRVQKLNVEAVYPSQCSLPLPLPSHCHRDRG